MNGILTGFFGAIVEAWAQLRIGKLRVLLSLVGVAAAVAAMTLVIALGQVSVDAINKVGSPISRLSGGEQQRVAIARALSRRPSVILADEPTGALDVDTGNSVMTLLEHQCAENGAALIIITHDLAVAGRAHTQYRLDHGTLTPISVTRRQVGSLEEFGEVVTPPTSPYPTVPASHEGAS